MCIPSVCFTHVVTEFGSEAGMKKLIRLEWLALIRPVFFVETRH